MKWNPFGRHLHSQIVWPLMLASVLVGLMATMVAVGIVGGLIEQWVQSAAQSNADVISYGITAMHDDLTAGLEIIGASEPLGRAALAGDAAAMDDVLSRTHAILRTDAVALLNPDGVVVASAGPLRKLPGARSGAAVAAGDDGRHRDVLETEGGYDLVAIAPFTVEGLDGWSLAATSRIDDELLAEIGTGVDASMLLLDARGDVVAAAYAPDARGGALQAAVQSASAEFRAAATALDDRPGSTEPLELDGREFQIAARDLVMHGHTTVPPLRLLVVVDAAVATTARSATTRLIGLWSAAGVLALLALNWWVARSVSRPLKALSESAARVAEGDFPARLDLAGANEVTDLAESFNRMTDSLRDRSESLTKKVLELATLYEMSRSLGSTLELETLLESILESAMRIFDVEIGYVTMIDRDSGSLTISAWKGADLSRATESTVRSSMSEWVIREGRPLIFNPRPGTGEGAGGDDVSGALAALCVPLLSPEGTIGAITVGSRDPEQRFTSDDVRLLATIANHVTIAVGNISLFSSVQEAYLATVRALAAAVDAKDPYTRGHSDGVARYALMIGESMGISAEQMVALEMAAYLHDIGKIGISEDILLKPGKLTDAEISQMRHHPLIGANILKPVAFPWPIAPIVRHHHEHYDGGGYPAGLRAEEIPVLARVLTVADSFEAMVADRPYRRGRSQQEAILELRRCAGTQFDPRIVDVFIGVLERAEAEYAESAGPDDEIGPDEAQAVLYALCEGMFAGFRRLGGPRLANTLERTVTQRLRDEGVPLAFGGGRLSATLGAHDEESGPRYLLRAVEIMAESIEGASGAGLADHFLSEALEGLPDRMRGHAERLGFSPAV